MSKIRLYLHTTITSFNFETSISVKRIITCVSKSKERYSRNTMSTRLNSFAKRNTNLYNIERNYLKNPRKFHSVLSHYYEHNVGAGGVTQKYELHVSFKNARCLFEFLGYPNES